MASKFSALCSSAALVKLKLPVRSVWRSIRMILLVGDGVPGGPLGSGRRSLWRELEKVAALMTAFLSYAWLGGAG